MFGNKKEQKELVPTQDENAVMDMFEGYSEEELGELQDVTGTTDKPESERRLPLYSFNLDMKDDQGNKISPDLFYDGQSGKQFSEINCALLFFKETRQWDERNRDTGKKTVMCRSYDRKVGQRLKYHEDGSAYTQDIDCERCPKRQGKAGTRKECTLIMRFVGWDLDRQQFFLLNCLRTSYIPASRYLEQNFFGKFRSKNGKRGDIPLYMFKTRVTLKEEEHPTLHSIYYSLKFENEGPNPKEVVLDLLPQARVLQQNARQEEIVQDAPQNASYADDYAEGGDSDTPF